MTSSVSVIRVRKEVLPQDLYVCRERACDASGMMYVYDDDDDDNDDDDDRFCHTCSALTCRRDSNWVYSSGARRHDVSLRLIDLPLYNLHDDKEATMSKHLLYVS